MVIIRPKVNKIIYDGSSKYSRYRIVDRVYNDRPSRLLLSGEKATPQSGLAFDDSPELLFDYNQRLFEVALSLEPQSILVIGGGAFTLPRALLAHLPTAKIDVVEIDRLLPKLARKYFQLRRSRRLKIHTTDGREYIDTHPDQSYDLIIVDAFSEYHIPESLLTIEAAQHYARLLGPEGAIAINIISKYRGPLPTLTHRMIASFKKSFQLIEIYPADLQDDQNSEQNLIFIGSKQDAIRLDYLLSAQVYPQNLDDSSLLMRDVKP